MRRDFWSEYHNLTDDKPVDLDGTGREEIINNGIRFIPDELSSVRTVKIFDSNMKLVEEIIAPEPVYIEDYWSKVKTQFLNCDECKVYTRRHNVNQKYCRECGLKRTLNRSLNSLRSYKL